MSDRLCHYEQPQTFTPKTEETIRSPFDSDKFTLEPSRGELAEERDGATVENSTVVRFISKPHKYHEIWVPVQARDNRSGELQSWWTKRPFIRTAELPGFEGPRLKLDEKTTLHKRDMLSVYKHLKLQELGEKKEENPESVTSDDWKNTYRLGMEGQDKTRQERHVLEVIDFKWYHWLKKPGSSYASLEVCAGRNCPLCKSPNSDTAKRRFGGRRYWTLNPSMWRAFLDEDLRLAEYVIAGDRVEKAKPGKNFVGMNCKSCGGEVVSKQDLLNATDKDVKKWTKNPVTCKHCGHKGYAAEQVFLTEKCEVPAKRLAYKDVPWKIEWKGQVKTKKGKGGVIYYNTQNGKYTFTPMIDHASELIDAGDFGPLPQELATPDWQQTPESVGEPIDLAFAVRPERKTAFGNWLSPRKFESREEYIQEVLASQAAWLQIQVPEVWRNLEYEENTTILEEEIPF